MGHPSSEAINFYLNLTLVVTRGLTKVTVIFDVFTSDQYKVFNELFAKVQITNTWVYYHPVWTNILEELVKALITEMVNLEVTLALNHHMEFTLNNLDRIKICQVQETINPNGCKHCVPYMS